MSMEVHVYICVPDTERGIEFYTSGLGLRLRRRLDSEWVELEGATVPIFLLSDKTRDFSQHWTPVHLDFFTDNLDLAVQKAQEAGAILERDIQSREWGRMANMADPFGNSFDLMEFVPGGYDRIEFG